MKRLLIAGIDPGTTLGYALLDLEGKVVKIRSSKQLGMSSLILDSIQEGKIVVIGTDKKNTPKFVEKTASKLGAKLIRPEEDLKVEDKKELAKEHGFGNEHERDALASAVYAFKRVRGLINKIDLYIKEHNKEDIGDDTKEKMLKDGNMNIVEVISLIEKPEKEKKEKRKRNKTGKTVEEERYEEEERMNPEEMKRVLVSIRKNMRKIIKAKTKKVVRIKNQRIGFLINKIEEQQRKINRLEKELEKFGEIIKKADKSLILRKIKNLSFEEVEKGELDKVIYVDDPNVFSEKSAERIMENVDVIISRKEMSTKLREKFNVTFVNAEKVDAEEENGLVIINKEKLESEMRKTDILKKVVEEYRESRNKGY